MTAIESAPEHLVLRSGSVTLRLDKITGKATMQRKLLFRARKPLERSLSEIADVKVDMAVDSASRAEVYSTMLVMRAGVHGDFPPSTEAMRKRASRRFVVYWASSRDARRWVFPYEHRQDCHCPKIPERIMENPRATPAQMATAT
jgi:hypothetical protein